ncbi:MAG: FAD-dependent oxidoreductase, partial [Myxococcales bacterium]|nr:FAD-dependent oxidoreductase [Myxococcales bacterium]
MRRYDFVVLGSGPAGQYAALEAASHGASVVIVEREPRVGGACLHRGTIPSK